MNQFWYTILCLTGGATLGAGVALGYVVVSSIQATNKQLEDRSAMFDMINEMLKDSKKLKRKSKNRATLESKNIKVEAIKIKRPTKEEKQ